MKLGPTVFGHVGDRTQRNLRTRWRVEERLANRVEIGRVDPRVPEDQREGDPTLKDLADFTPQQRSFEGIGRLASRQSVPRQCQSIELHPYRGNVSLLFGREINHAGHGVHDGFDLLTYRAEHTEILAKHFDGNVGPGTREHVIYPVGDGLPNRHIGARNKRESVPDLLQHDIPRAVLHSQLDVDLSRLHALHVLVKFGTPRATSRGGHL